MKTNKSSSFLINNINSKTEATKSISVFNQGSPATQLKNASAVGPQSVCNMAQTLKSTIPGKYSTIALGLWTLGVGFAASQLLTDDSTSVSGEDEFPYGKFWP